jgi:dihydrofolate synthase/folylpolyglutamate synthase
MSREVDARYRALLEELFGARRAGVVLGLARMQALLAQLGHPERRLGAIVHVAGTNGKGSTVAMVAAMARAHGLRAGQYTSPHLATVRERISDDDGWIDRASFVAAADEVWAAGGRELTFFEQLTAIGFVALARRRLDVTVLEVGLGGRLDATNVVDSDVAVVTGVALDHQALLGDSLELIAAEKAGILRRGKPAILGASGEAAALPTLVAAAQAAGCTPIRVIGEAELAAVPAELALRGEHQRRNAAAALAAIGELVAQGVLPDDAAARRAGLLAARHPGRFETLARQPQIVVDGAHNPHGAEALAEAMAELPRPRALILGVSSDKDVAGIAAPLCARADHVIATAYRQERALPASELAGRLRSLGTPHREADIEAPPEAHDEAGREVDIEARIEAGREADREAAAGADRAGEETDAAAGAATSEEAGARGAADGRPRAGDSQAVAVEVAADIGEALPRAVGVVGEGGSVVIAGSLFLVGEARVLVLGGEADPIRLSDPSGARK